MRRLQKSAERPGSIGWQANEYSPRSSQATYFNYQKYAGLMPSDMKKLRELEDENRRLKKIVADPMLDKAMLRDVVKRML